VLILIVGSSIDEVRHDLTRHRTNNSYKNSSVYCDIKVVVKCICPTATLLSASVSQSVVQLLVGVGERILGDN